MLKSLRAIASRVAASPWAKRGGSVLLFASGVAALAFGSLYLLQEQLLYLPRTYARDARYYAAVEASLREAAGGLERIHLELPDGAGSATAFYVPPEPALRGAGDDLVVWVAFNGNAALALDWADVVRSVCAAAASSPGGSAARPSFLLIDYPGYGENGGRPSPEANAALAEAAWRALLARPDVAPARRVQARALGFSLGSANALAFAATRGAHEAVDRVVLLAPFTSVPEVARRLFGRLPALDLLVKHRFDNVAALRGLATAVEREPARPAVQVDIVSGTVDEIVPFDMSRTLAGALDAPAPGAASNDFPRTTVRFHAVPGAGHNDLLMHCMPQVVRLLLAPLPPQSRM